MVMIELLNKYYPGEGSAGFPGVEATLLDFGEPLLLDVDTLDSSDEDHCL